MRRAALFACGGALLAISCRWAAAGDLRNGGLPEYLLLHCAAALVFLAALALVRQGERAGDAPGPRAFALALGLAVACRVVLLVGAEPSLSDDVHRYLWEGRVQLAGWNPYRTPPADPALAGLRDGVWLGVNHREVPAVYGPLLEALFAGLALLGAGLRGLGAAFCLADLAVIALLRRLLVRRGRSAWWVLVWAWHPLVIMEVAGQRHLEAVPIALAVWALDLDESGRRRGAALALGAAIAGKYLPLLALPAFVRRASGWRARLGRLGLVALPGAALGGVYLAWPGPARPSAGLERYAEVWRFNDGGYALVDGALQASGVARALAGSVVPALVDVPPGVDPASDWALLQYPAKAAVGLLLAAAVVALARRRADGGVDLERALFAAGALFLVLSPTVHPWYALWVVPFLALARGRTAWLYLSLALPVAYAVLLRYDGSPASWAEPAWVRWAEYGPFAALLALDLALRWRNRDRAVRDSASSSEDGPCPGGPAS